jgi:dUTP pyrophosphatase
MRVNVKVLTEEFYERHGLPARATDHSAGIDMRAATYERIAVPPGKTVLVPTGLVFEVPVAVVMLLTPRSSLGHKHGIVLGNTVGVIDPDYRGEVQVSVWNRNVDGDCYYINPGERICQALFMPFIPVDLNSVEALSETVRGSGGFGSTGN